MGVRHACESARGQLARVSVSRTKPGIQKPYEALNSIVRRQVDLRIWVSGTNFGYQVSGIGVQRACESARGQLALVKHWTVTLLQPLRPLRPHLIELHFTMNSDIEIHDKPYHRDCFDSQPNQWIQFIGKSILACE